MLATTLRLEPLEDRAVPATLTVNSLADDTTAGDGLVTLREALAAAEGDTATDLGQTGSGADTIVLAVAGTVNLTGALPAVTTAVTIQGGGPAVNTVRRDTGGDYRIFAVDAAASLTLTGLTVADGRVNGNGGGVLNDGALTATDCVFTGHHTFTTSVSRRGTAIWNTATGTLALTRVEFFANTNAATVGTVANDGAMTIADSLFRDTTTQNEPGLRNDGTGVVTNTTFSNLRASNTVGAVNNRGTLTLVNCTITNNFASGAATSGGIDTTGTTTLINTVVAGNVAAGTFDDVRGTLDPASANNVIGTAGNGGLTTGVNGNVVGTAAPLAPLADYGGPLMTHALLPGNPAIDGGAAGPAPPADARGLGRVGVVDAGAFESRGFVMTATGGGGQAAQINTAFAAPLAVSVVANSAIEPVDGGLVTFTAPGSGPTAAFPASPALVVGGAAGTPAFAGAVGGAFTVTASAAGANSVTFALSATVPPAITSPDAVTFTTTTAGAFTVTATGFPAPALAVTGALPAGVTFDPATGALTGTPTQSGVFPLTVAAANGVAPDAAQSFTLTVNAPPAITNPDLPPGAIGRPYTATLVVTGFPAPTVAVTGLPRGLAFDPATRTLTGSPADSGTFAVRVTAANGIAPDADRTFDLVVGAVPAFSVGSGVGVAAEVRLFNSDGTLARSVRPFGDFAGGVSVATGDVDGDGVKDAVAGAGAGGGPRVAVVSGATGAVIADFFAYEDSFRGGVWVAVGDTDGDGVNEIVVGAGVGGGPRVRVLRADGSARADLLTADDTLRLGVTVAAADLDGDGAAEVVTGVGGRVLVYAGRTLALLTAFDTGLPAPVSVAVGAGTIHVGSGVGVSAAVRAFTPAGELVSADPAFEEAFAGGARIATADLDADGGTDVVLGAADGGAPRVRVPGRAIDFFAFDETLRGGVFVG